jgi:hypothetical protein
MFRALFPKVAAMAVKSIFEHEKSEKLVFLPTHSKFYLPWICSIGTFHNDTKYDSY